MRVSIRVKGHLDARLWLDWFEGLQITQEPEGTSLLTGPLADQAALFGVLSKIRSLNLRLLSLSSEDNATEVAQLYRDRALINQTGNNDSCKAPFWPSVKERPGLPQTE